MEAAPLALIIDDEPAIARLIALELSGDGIRTAAAYTASDGLAACAEARPDIVLLDLILPDASGIEILPRIKRAVAAPVLVITAWVSDQLRAQAMQAGADDLAIKPFAPGEIVSRVRFLLRLDARPARAMLRAGELQIDVMRRRVSWRQAPIDLSHTEWQLLLQLASHPGAAVLNRDLLANVWGPEYANDVAFLRTWIHRLRVRLRDDPARPRIITPFQDAGFVLVADAVEGAGGFDSPRDQARIG